MTVLYTVLYRVTIEDETFVAANLTKSAVNRLHDSSLHPSRPRSVSLGLLIAGVGWRRSTT